MHYSPVRRSPPGSKLPVLPLDLHVLGLPPAFNLSHDQTLQLKSFTALRALICSSITSNIRSNKFSSKFLLIVTNDFNLSVINQ